MMFEAIAGGAGVAVYGFIAGLFYGEMGPGNILGRLVVAILWPVALLVLAVFESWDWFRRRGIGPIGRYHWVPPVGKLHRQAVEMSRQEVTMGAKPGQRFFTHWEYLRAGVWKKRDRAGWQPDDGSVAELDEVD